MSQIHLKIRRLYVYSAVYWCFCTFLESRGFLSAVFFLTSLRLSVNKFIWDPTKHLVKISKHIYSENVSKTHKLTPYMQYISWNVTFPDSLCFYRAVDFSAQYFFWQVSDCLSRKFIWDPTKHLVEISKHTYSENAPKTS